MSSRDLLSVGTTTFLKKAPARVRVEVAGSWENFGKISLSQKIKLCNKISSLQNSVGTPTKKLL
ncbi:hypothetical protein CH380_09680 [Leptospira adleri]|uniref:Uncharacterized protein n=1 Tax=Leptospira adleri TaxID=2023186 RepID=A0A2M9YPK6_9LEPT|nr:hypothetical protein CH380_09680 [Leptospira adleri]PJZ63034.1 hypothetical protein CH376_05040 [Leptospira adleri]